MKKYSIKNIGNAFKNAAQTKYAEYKKQEEFKKTPEYKKQVLDNVDFQIALQQKQNKLMALRAKKNQETLQRKHDLWNDFK